MFVDMHKIYTIFYADNYISQFTLITRHAICKPAGTGPATLSLNPHQLLQKLSRNMAVQ